MAKYKKNISLFDKIRYKYRLIIINDDTFEQKTSIKLSKFNIYVWVGSFFLLIVLFITSLIAFTNLKYYLPGVGQIDFRNKINELYFKTDSLSKELDTRNLWISNIQKIVSGDIDSLYYYKEDQDTIKLNIDTIDLSFISEEDKKLREEVETQMELENLDHKISNADFNEDKLLFSNLSLKNHLVPPLQGIIIKNYSLEDQHFGVDIAGVEDETIHAVYDGVVILSEWNPKTGYVIGIQHPGDMISFYKHNSLLMKKRGTFVTKGEAIAIIGDSGELSTGPHLHFELWRNGTIQDPTKYIDLEKLN
jgi:septal ring factor EnvC (AmiA/AmiB activator)